VSALLRATPGELADLVLPVLPDAGDLTDGEVVRAFALGAWTGVVEPGDAVGGVVRSVLGPAVGLRAVLEAAVGHDDPRPGLLAGRLLDAGATRDDVGRLDLARALERWRPRLETPVILRSFRTATALGSRLLVPGVALWPTALDELGDHAPVALWARGPASVPAPASSIAIVGSRAATSYGEQVSAELADGVADRGLAVVSGAAYGVDGAAHRAALAASATTVAVMAGGVDHLYPAGHDGLLRRIIETGLMISEAPCGGKPSRWRFLQRNRLIAALTAATVVVEAGGRSGSLNTAAHAQSLGRPVGAVPGPVTSPSSVGCHALIRSGLADCVTSVDDVLELAGASTDLVAASYQGRRLDPETMRVLDALSTTATRETDELAVASGLSLETVRDVLAELDLSGAARRHGSGWRRVRGRRDG
jgi:DNA processing protein